MSTMIERLAQTRHADHYRGSGHAERYNRPRPVAACGERAASPDTLQAIPDTLQTARSRAGWLLVGLGLRLALPRQRDAGRRITLLGR